VIIICDTFLIKILWTGSYLALVRTGTLCAEVIIPISATKGRLLYVHVVGETGYKENDPRLEVTSALTGLKQIKKIWHAELIDKKRRRRSGYY
jgi:hypothetical protein